ncbi:hypothetical protein M9H77_24102 [Catharanthus roseus]|uniref:Uncharacterized protein n=1 Tax=Catharanthus roseus TaxID=4058 RepID=A0ACC0AV60_CATRO|nr:hypothetical protein M9H77_24102 [Catharanthus roseus]
MLVQKSYPFHESGYQGRQPTRDGRRGGLGGRGYNKSQEEVPRYEASHEDNLDISNQLELFPYTTYEDMCYLATKIENRKGIGFSRTNLPSSRTVVFKPLMSTYKSWLKKYETPKVAFKDNSKPKVEEKGRLITNPTRCLKNLWSLDKRVIGKRQEGEPIVIKANKRVKHERNRVIIIREHTLRE